MTLLTPREVAARLRVSPRTVYLWLDEGRLPAIRLSERVTRIPAEAVDALVAAATVPVRDAPIAAEARAVYAPAAPAVPGITLATLRSLRAEVLAIARRRHAYDVRVFGSVARGEATGESDLDLLVDLDADASLLDLGGLAEELTELLSVRVDVTPVRNLKPLIRDRVLREAVPL